MRILIFNGIMDYYFHVKWHYMTRLTLGICLRCSLKSSVRPPSPIDVKKLIENLVFLGLSLGNIPEKAS